MIDKHGEPVRENYRRQGEVRERERIVELLKRRVCFDALAMHDELENIRTSQPDRSTVVGYCDHHGGKCSDLLQLIVALESQL